MSEIDSLFSLDLIGPLIWVTSPVCFNSNPLCFCKMTVSMFFSSAFYPGPFWAGGMTLQWKYDRMHSVNYQCEHAAGMEECILASTRSICRSDVPDVTVARAEQQCSFQEYSNVVTACESRETLDE